MFKIPIINAGGIIAGCHGSGGGVRSDEDDSLSKCDPLYRRACLAHARVLSNTREAEQVNANEMKEKLVECFESPEMLKTGKSYFYFPYGKFEMEHSNWAKEIGFECMVIGHSETPSIGRNIECRVIKK